MFLPSIPSWLPLWSLLSPEDAISGGGGGGGKAAGSRSGRAAPPVATGQVAGAETKSPEGLDAVRAGDGSGGDDHCNIDGGTGCRLAAAGADDGGRGAVRLVQTVAAAQTPYRYAAVFHFWDVVRHGEEREEGRLGGSLLGIRCRSKAAPAWNGGSPAFRSLRLAFRPEESIPSKRSCREDGTFDFCYHAVRVFARNKRRRGSLFLAFVTH